MAAGTDSMKQSGQILFESLLVVILLSSVLLMLGIFFKKSERTIQRYQFQEPHHERKVTPPYRR